MNLSWDFVVLGWQASELASICSYRVRVVESWKRRQQRL